MTKFLCKSVCKFESYENVGRARGGGAHKDRVGVIHGDGVGVKKRQTIGRGGGVKNAKHVHWSIYIYGVPPWGYLTIQDAGKLIYNGKSSPI